MESDEIPKEVKPKNEAIKLLKNTKDVLPAVTEAKIAQEIKPVENEIKKLSMEEIEEIRNIMAERRLGGRSEAGFIAKPVDPEQLKKDRANAWLKSTGLRIK